MGLFWKTSSDYLVEEIQELVGQTNRQLAAMSDSLVANNGISYSNMQEISDISERLTHLFSQVESKVNQLPSSKQSSLTVPWIDGRYFPFAMWAMSYNMAINRLRIAFKKWKDENGI